MRLVRKGHVPCGQNFEQRISSSVFLEGEIICSNKDLLQFLDGGSGQMIGGLERARLEGLDKEIWRSHGPLGPKV